MNILKGDHTRSVIAFLTSFIVATMDTLVIDNIEVHDPAVILREEDDSDIIFSLGLSDHGERDVLKCWEAQATGVDNFFDQQVAIFWNWKSTEFDWIGLNLARSFRVRFLSDGSILFGVLQSDQSIFNGLLWKSIKEMQCDIALLLFRNLFHFLFFQFELDIILAFL